MMSDKIKELLLEETYSFQIIVEINDCCYAGKLDATPEKITLKITGELRCEDDDFNPRQVAQKSADCSWCTKNHKPRVFFETVA